MAGEICHSGIGTLLRTTGGVLGTAVVVEELACARREQKRLAPLLTDTVMLEDAILASSSVHWEGGYAAMALGDYRLFAATPLEESYVDSGVFLHIPSLLDNEINETSKESAFLP